MKKAAYYCDITDKVQNGLDFQEELSNLTECIEGEIRKSAEFGLYGITLSHKDDSRSFYEIKMPRFLHYDFAEKFIRSIFDNLESSLVENGFIVKKCEFKIYYGKEYFCDYEIILRWR